MRAPRKGAAGACRRNRRQRGERPEWVRPYRRARRAIDASASLVFAAFSAAIQCEDRAAKRPVSSARRVNHALRGIVTASLGLAEAKHQLAIARECLSRDPEQQKGDAADILALATEHWEAVANHIHVAVADAMAVQVQVLAGLKSGELVPERPSDHRPRIILAPRPVPVRAFLAARQPYVAQRITPLLRRRRRTPRPAEIQVPKPSVLGRAPPLSSAGLL